MPPKYSVGMLPIFVVSVGCSDFKVAVVGSFLPFFGFVDHHQQPLTIMDHYGADHEGPATAVSSPHPDAVSAPLLQSHPRPAMSSLPSSFFHTFSPSKIIGRKN